MLLPVHRASLPTEHDFSQLTQSQACQWILSIGVFAFLLRQILRYRKTPHKGR